METDEWFVVMGTVLMLQKHHLQLHAAIGFRNVVHLWLGLDLDAWKIE